MNSKILPILALMLSVGIFFAYVSPTWSGSIAATKAAISSDDQALAAAKEYGVRQNELASARDAIGPADLDRLAAFLPDSVDNVRLILNLNALAARAGLSLSNVDVISGASGSDNPSSGILSAPAENPVGSVDLSLSALGTYPALQDFLRNIEKSQRLLDVQDLTVKGSNTGLYTYQMKIRLYWLR